MYDLKTQFLRRGKSLIKLYSFHEFQKLQDVELVFTVCSKLSDICRPAQLDIA